MPEPSGPHGDAAPAQPAAEAPTEILTSDGGHPARKPADGADEAGADGSAGSGTEDAGTGAEGGPGTDPDPDVARATAEAPTEVIPEIADDRPTQGLPAEGLSDEGLSAEADTTVLEVETGDRAEAAESAGRQFTAPGFDAGDTEAMASMDTVESSGTNPTPAETGARPGTGADDAGTDGSRTRPLLERLASLGSERGRSWLVAVGLAVAVLLVIVVLGVLWMAGSVGSRVSAEERVRETLESFNVAVQNGDLATLRGITCGEIRDGYVNYDQATWDDIYSRVAVAKQYPVIASVDEVVVNKEHAEANVTAYMAFAPQIRSTRSFDLQYHDHQWKICQSRTG